MRAIWAIGLLALATDVAAQGVPRNEYYHHLPAMSKLVTQTRASAQFNLYGDRGSASYRDEDFDGIDDVRAARLHALAARYSPILRRNNFSRPRDFRVALGDAQWLKRDVWQQKRLVRSDSIWLAGAAFAKASGDRALASDSDDKLLALLRKYDPRGGDSRLDPAEGDSAVVLFLDFPGEDQKSWRRAYQHSEDTRAYVHAFIDDNEADSARYALVLQYWFFYPFNDGTNNHEGDWEHLNVILTNAARAVAHADSLVKTRMTAAELRALIEGPDPVESSEIAAVEYYFHETYTLLNYAAVRHKILTNSTANTNAHFLHLHVWDEPDFVERTLLERMSDPRLATHPVAYLGGNNRGPDEFMSMIPRFRAAYNRNAHGSYPFPGTWQAVGPMGSTEQLNGRAVATIREVVGDSVVFDDPRFMMFRKQDLVMVPDWERVEQLVLDHPIAREQWAWLLLPIRWGYPASVSPGSGMLEHTDLGQIAPEGPAYQPTWNRLAPSTGWRVYNPQVLRVLMVPATPWSRVKSGWGALNVPVAFLGFMPGWSVVVAQVLPWVTGTLDLFGAPPAKTYYPGDPPFRFSSTALGVASVQGGQAYARLLPAGTDSASLRIAETVGSDKRGTLDAGTAQRIWLNMFYGRRLSVENTFTINDAVLSYDDRRLDDGDATGASGTLRYRELTGGFRFNALASNDDALQVYLRGGYGWTWYKLQNVSVDGVAVQVKENRGYAVSLLPSKRWWPNTWYTGIGAEVFMPKDWWILNRVGLGARVETSALWHRLGANSPAADDHLGWVRRGDNAFAVLIAW